ncbi:MAG: glycerol-3-phosphate dehydrogenase/oxidase [Spirochaetes bacterium]|nr:glycerol-3-phosphate dehydrogenase/oxidase [Spirochaetota bacterium]
MDQPQNAPGGLPDRAAALSSLDSRVWDLVVVGGGIVGAGIAHEAARCGLATLLLERRDFASGTSSRSSKLVHGGIRYLAQFHFPLVFEALRERNLLIKDAPVSAQRFLFPGYRGEKPPAWLLEVGMCLYDLLSWRGSPGHHRYRGAKATSRTLPSLRPEGLVGSSEYFDARTDDSRLVIEELRAAAAAGATVINYAEAVGLERRGAEVEAVEARDILTGKDIRVRCRAVAGAVGPWLEPLLRLAGRPEERVLRTTKGAHLFVRARAEDPDRAVVLNDTKSGRILFFVPWKPGVQLVGTTDTDYRGDFDRVHADRADIDYIRTNHARAFRAPLRTDEILGTQAGLRPLLFASGHDARTTSREHRLLIPGDGNLVAIGGGKLTTYRPMARQVVAAARNILASRGAPQPAALRPRRPLVTRPPLPASCPLPKEAITFCLGHFGYSDAVIRLAERAAREPEWARPLAGDRRLPRALVAEAVRDEMAVRVGDVMYRRTRLALTEPDGALEVARAVAEEMGSLLGWDDHKREAEFARYAVEAEADHAALRS